MCLQDEDAEKKQMEKERLRALRVRTGFRSPQRCGLSCRCLQARDQKEYVRLLKKAKNERLLTLLKQTEQYMAKLVSE